MSGQHARYRAERGKDFYGLPGTNGNLASRPSADGSWWVYDFTAGRIVPGTHRMWPGKAKAEARRLNAQASGGAA